jgi:AraC-like DNA-binding protein
LCAAEPQSGVKLPDARRDDLAFDDENLSFHDGRMIALVRAASLSNFAETARQAGLDPVGLLREARIDPAALSHPDMRIRAERVGRLLETAAERSGWLNFGLRMAESRRLSDFGAVGLLIAHQPSLREVLDTVARYRPLLNEALALHVEPSGDLAIVREELVTEGPNPGRQARELAIGTLFRMFRTLLGPRWRPQCVNFTHAAPPDLGVHRRLFGFEVQFESEFNGIVCEATDLDWANPAADRAMARYAQQFVDTLASSKRSSVVLEARQAIHLLLPLGQASIERIARGLGMNARTLQRRLEEEGLSFSELINDVRRELAMRYLASRSYSLTRIAELLGYAQSSSFTRWFISQFGSSPRRWRAASLGAAPMPASPPPLGAE